MEHFVFRLGCDSNVEDLFSNFQICHKTSQLPCIKQHVLEQRLKIILTLTNNLK